MEDRTAGVLRWVNEVREKHGKPTIAELPKGDHSAGGCVLARALTFDDTAAFVGSHYVRWTSTCGGDRMSLPFGIQQFVADFDAGKIPELVDA